MPVITEVVEGDEIVIYSREDVLDATAPRIEVARRPLAPADAAGTVTPPVDGSGTTTLSLFTGLSSYFMDPPPLAGS